MLHGRLRSLDIHLMVIPVWGRESWWAVVTITKKDYLLTLALTSLTGTIGCLNIGIEQQVQVPVTYQYPPPTDPATTMLKCQ